MNKKKLLILGGSSDIGIEVIKIYLKHNFSVLAQYNKGIKIFSLVKENKNFLKQIKFDFSSDNQKIEKFFKKKRMFQNQMFLLTL